MDGITIDSTSLAKKEELTSSPAQATEDSDSFVSDTYT